ncbi:hypothetical protein ACFYU8_18220 [Brevibacillus sp. NPDC003359]|uniref:hypothetical protein n=1 Tax=unclassified Brevibacillus TaxID=2684853 RepID=UPI0036CEFD8C
MSLLLGQYIIDSQEDEEEIHFEEIEMSKDVFAVYLEGDDIELELERAHVKNIRKHLALQMELIDGNTTTVYHYPNRTNFEVSGGYKIAKRRQKRHFHVLRDVEIFNLYFRFKNNKMNCLKTSAMMYRPQHTREEWILLLPDDTVSRLSNEVSKYSRIASNMVLDPDTMLDGDYHSEILENLKLLDLHERCAQSLLHEYGHLLHWRMFDALGFQTNVEVYRWFFEAGYAELLDRRSSEFYGASIDDKVYLLKESLVEDYRIWLNMLDRRGKFILPNLNTFYADFEDPSLLEEGVAIMKKMLSKAMNGQASLRKSGFSQEPDRVAAAERIYSAAKRAKWKPGQPRMTTEDHLNLMKEQETYTTPLIMSK